MIFGVAVAWGARRNLRQLPFGRTYSEKIIGGFIWVLIFFYLFRKPYLFLATIEGDLRSWMFAVSISWALFVLGLPMVLPRPWAAVLACLRNGAIQWPLTVAAAIAGYCVFTAAQYYADNTIQSFVQTHPDQFPGAQRALTAIGAAYGWIIMLHVIALLATFIAPMVTMRSKGRSIWRTTAAMAVFLALVTIPPNALNAFQKVTLFDEHGSRAIQGSFQENIIILTSFIPNRVGEGVLRSETEGFIQQTRLACRNLPPEVYVAFVHPGEVMPNKVVVAEPKSGKIAEGAPAYSYSLSACQNSMNPDGIK